MIKELIALKDEKYENYPPIGTPEACLILSLDGDTNFTILGYTGSWCYDMFALAGVDGEESGVKAPIEPGYWVLEEGRYWETKDWETGYTDDCGLNGTLRPAILRDFEHFNADIPKCMLDQQQEIVNLNDKIIDYKKSLDSLMKIIKTIANPSNWIKHEYTGKTHWNRKRGLLDWLNEIIEDNKELKE